MEGKGGEGRGREGKGGEGRGREDGESGDTRWRLLALFILSD